MLLASELDQVFFVRLEGILSRLKHLFGSKFLSVFVLDRLLNVFHFLLAVLFAVGLHSGAFFLANGLGPDLNIVNLFVFLDLEVFTFLLKNTLVLGHNLIVVKVIGTSLNVNDSVLANLFDTFDNKLIEHITGTVLTLSVELVHEFVTNSHLLILDFLELKLNFLFIFFLLTLFGKKLHLLLEISGDLLLVSSHGFFQLLDFGGFFFKLLLYLDENTHTFLSLGFLLSNLGEGNSKLLAKVGQVLSHLELLIERNDSVFMIDLYSDQVLVVADVEELLNLFPGAVES
jgi:hypothetical protein